MFRFSIRELMILTLTVAMGFGWWVDRNRLIWKAAAREALHYDNFKILLSNPNASEIHFDPDGKLVVVDVDVLPGHSEQSPWPDPSTIPNPPEE